MLGRFLTAGLAAVLAVTALSGCGGAGEGGATSPSPAMTRTQAPLDRAKDALLTAQEIPVPPPSDTVEIPSSYSAQGDQVSAPWPQFMICSSVGKADEGPPTVVEPGAVAGAWAFGVATTEGGGQGYSQIDQYAIVYTDEAAAQAHAGGGDVVWITHAGVARCVHWLLTHGAARMPLSHEWPQSAPGYGAWTTVLLPLKGQPQAAPARG